MSIPDIKALVKSSWITYECLYDCSGHINGTYYVTVSIEVAVKLYREAHPERKVSDFVALDGFMTERKARFCGPPDYLRIGLADSVLDVVERCGGNVQHAAKKLGIGEEGVAKLMNDKNDNPPSHVLKRLGLFRSVRFFSEEMK